MLRSRNRPSWRAMTMLAAAGLTGMSAMSPDQAAAVTGDQPVTLVVQRDGALIDAQVIAAEACACGGRIRIESRSGSGNHSVNSSSFGQIREPGAVLSHVRFGGSEQWSIRLTVSIDGRDDYVITRTSDASR